jgi:hypothetical protein
MPSKTKQSKVITGVHKTMKLLRVGNLHALEKKLCEVPKGQAVVLRDKRYTKIDCGKFTVLVPQKR